MQCDFSNPLIHMPKNALDDLPKSLLKRCADNPLPIVAYLLF